MKDYSNLNLQEDIAEYKSVLQDQLYLHGKADYFKKTAKACSKRIKFNETLLRLIENLCLLNF